MHVRTGGQLVTGLHCYTVACSRHNLPNNHGSRFAESPNRRRSVLHDSRGESGTRRRLRVPRVLPELRHTVYESAEHPLDTEELPRAEAALRVGRRSTEVSVNPPLPPNAFPSPGDPRSGPAILAIDHPATPR